MFYLFQWETDDSEKSGQWSKWPKRLRETESAADIYPGKKKQHLFRNLCTEGRQPVKNFANLSSKCVKNKAPLDLQSPAASGFFSPDCILHCFHHQRF